MAHILAVGIATLDIINTVEAFPTEDAEVRALSQQQSRGGNATNTLSILSQLGHNCAWAGVLIDEPDSHTINNDLQKHKIDTTHCRTLSEGKMPTSYITLNQQSGSRTIVHHRDCPEFSFDDFNTIDLSNYDWLHFEGRNIAETVLMLEHCKHYFPDLPCSVEIEKPRTDISRLFALADVLLFSKHYAESQGFNNADDFLNSLTLNVLASCAWGEQGAWLITQDKQLIHSPAFQPDTVVDTLGAGDTFNAGLIHSLIDQQSEQTALNFACQLAGHKCGQLGLNITHFNSN
jgi:ketohexokinase